MLQIYQSMTNNKVKEWFYFILYENLMFGIQERLSSSDEKAIFSGVLVEMDERG